MPYEEPKYLPWDGQSVPITFLAGYLGAGKTTLINELLATADKPIAVMVNDVGAVNVDASLIRRQDGNTIELTDGCICCSISGGFGEAFDLLRTRAIPPAHLIVELSGVADPGRVLPWARTAGFALDGVVTLIDTDQFTARMSEAVPSVTMQTQISAADLIVLTKLDIADDKSAREVRKALDELAPQAAILEVATATAANILSLGAGRSGSLEDLPLATLFDGHEVSIQAMSRPSTRKQLDEVLDSLPPQTVRAKGVSIDPSGHRWLVQIVGRRRRITELPPSEPTLPTDLVVITVPESAAGRR